MLYSLLTTVIILSFLLPITSVYCFVKGYNLKAEKVGEKAIQPPKIKTLSKIRDDREAKKEYQETIETLKAINEYGGDYGL